MKTIRGGILVTAGLLVVLSLLFISRSKPPAARTDEPYTAPAPDKRAGQTNATHRPHSIGGSKRAADFTDAEKAALAKAFEEKFKPAIARWAKAYGDHVPFPAEDVTLDKFHSRVGETTYTFMVDGYTFSVQNRSSQADVVYMAQRAALLAVNAMPSGGTAPDLTVPIEREEIIQMVKAESGTEYQPNQVVIKPTGAASSMMGGAFVDVAQVIINGGLSYSNTSYSMIFQKDGKMVYYDCGPLF
ncbi:MAG: hypothetical protein JWR26_3204 [Pedosphaera sp.]|nr:hypothetical protein [Pedosphaera sp.]